MAKPRKQADGSRSEANKYDKIIKENLLKALPELMFLLAGFRIVEVQQENIELQHTKETKADFIGIVTNEKGEKAVLHLEFQLKGESKMVHRMYDYRGYLRRRFSDLPIYQYVIYLGSTPPTMQTELNEHNLMFRFELCWLQDIYYSHLMSSDKPELIVLAMLADFGTIQPEQIAEQIVEKLKISAESNLDFTRFTNQLRMLANIRNLQPLIDSIMEKISEFFVEERDPLYKKGVGIGVEKGVEIGMEKGMEKGKEIGIEKGIEIGSNQTTLDLIINLILQSSHDDTFIASVTGVDPERVGKIRQIIQLHPTDYKARLKDFHLPR